MPTLTQWAQDILPEGFAAFDMPQSHRVRVRMTTGFERIKREIKGCGCACVASIVPNTMSRLPLFSALLAECDEEWMIDKIYFNMNA
ncbi:MAG: hypothetical protein E5299_01142 [Burkholderia gladioli]|nr:MAG: hypothetical protein E5299_01142 [Burkholderia gladioli]